MSSVYVAYIFNGHVVVLERCTGASDMERQREGRSLSVQLDATNQSSQNFTDDAGGCADNTSKTAAAAAASDLAEDRDDDEDEDLSYDEHDSVGERSGKY